MKKSPDHSDKSDYLQLLKHVLQLENTIQQMTEQQNRYNSRFSDLLEARLIPEYMTIREAAVYMKTSIRTVRRRIESGDFIGYKIGGYEKSKILICKKEIDNYIRGAG